MSTYITLQNLATGYGKKQIANQLNATLQQGELVALLGPNGCGKSTLLRTIAGLQPALSGTILCMNRPLRSYPPRSLAQTISIVLTQRPEDEALTVRDVVSMGRIPYQQLLKANNTQTDQQAVQHALQLTHTEAYAQRGINALSDGERQRVFIAKSLAQNTPIILLDEPTAFLDFATKVHTLRLLRTLAHQEHKAILLSTHDVELALHLTDKLWLLHTDGITMGSPQQLAQQGSIATFFQNDAIRFDATQMRFEY